tara:strand:- start:103 stop:444 length:342 start_codon:yes stop_codon:yes gene_type:complete
VEIKGVVSFDKDVVWKSDHTSNPYAIVLKASKIWKFTKNEYPKSYEFFVKLIKENSKIFKWGLHKQKSFKVFYHNQFCYFQAPPDIIYKAIVNKEEKKKKKKVTKKTKDKLIY